MKARDFSGDVLHLLILNEIMLIGERERRREGEREKARERERGG